MMFSNQIGKQNLAQYTDGWLGLKECKLVHLHWFYHPVSSTNDDNERTLSSAAISQKLADSLTSKHHEEAIRLMNWTT